MSHQQHYIVQYVGFQTGLDEETFLKSWKPFASSFKSAGIESIDIYTLQNKEILTYLSRNVWPAEAYLKNFPTGVPGAARTRDVNVLQFGGYWLNIAEKDRPEHMTLLFQKEVNDIEEGGAITRLSVTEQVLFKQLLVIHQPTSAHPSTDARLVFGCSHLKSF